MGDYHYTFSVAGQAGVLVAFRSIESAAQSHQRQINRTSAGQQQASKREAKAINETAKLAERVARQQERAQARALRQQASEQKRAQAQLVREVNVAHRQAAREQGIVTRHLERGRRIEAQQTARLRAKEERSTAREQKRIADAAHRQERQRIQNATRYYKASQAERIRDSRRAEQHRQRQFKADAAARSNAFGLAASFGGAMLGAAKYGAGAGMAVGGAALRGAFATDDIARQIAVSGRGVGQTADPAAIRRQLQATAIATPGITAAEAGGGLQQFVSKTGRLDIGQAMLGDFATVASATGAKMDEVAGAAAAMFQKFDISTIDGMREAFATLTFQGKQGSFELKDAASQYDRLTSAAGKLGIGKGAGAVATLGGLTQIARGGTGSAEQAATSVEAMFRQLTSKSGELKGAGVNVFEQSGARKGQARSIQDVLVETVAKVGGTDLEAKKVGLQKIFGDEGGRGVIAELTKTYGDAMSKGTDGVKAMRDQLTRATTTTAKWNEVQQDASTMQASVSNTLTGVWERLQATVGERLIPIVTTWAGKLAEWADAGGLDSFASALESAASLLGTLADAAIGVAQALGLVEEQHYKPGERVQKNKAKLEAMGLSDSEAERISYAQQLMDRSGGRLDQKRALEIAGVTGKAEQVRAGQAMELGRKIKADTAASVTTASEGPKNRADFEARFNKLIAEGPDGQLSNQGGAFLQMMASPTNAAMAGNEAGNLGQAAYKTLMAHPGKATELLGKDASPALLKLVEGLATQASGQTAEGKAAMDSGANFAELNAASQTITEGGAAISAAADKIVQAAASIGKADIGTGG